MYAARIPIVTISWLKLTSPPRIFGGTSSPMYIGATNDAVPTARPSTKRATISSHTFGASAEAIAATANTMPATIESSRRPIDPAQIARSERAADRAEQQRADDRRLVEGASRSDPSG